MTDRDKVNERVSILWQLGWSYENIGTLVGLTRCAVGGICYRMGLRRSRENGMMKSNKRGQFVDLPEEPGEIPLLDLESEQCRWPTGVGEDGRAVFCGCRKQERSSYCLQHSERATAPRAKSAGMRW